MVEQQFNWTFFKRRIYIKDTSIEELFKKWVTPKGLTEWFIAKAKYLDVSGNIRGPEEIVETGDTFLWAFHNGSTVQGKVIGIKTNLEFRFTF